MPACMFLKFKLSLSVESQEGEYTGKSHPPVAMLLRTGLNNVVLPRLSTMKNDFLPCTKYTQQNMHNLFGLLKRALFNAILLPTLFIVVNDIIVSLNSIVTPDHSIGNEQ